MTAAVMDGVPPERVAVSHKRSMYYVGLFASFFWGAGTNFIHRQFYPIYGISIGDLVFLAWCALALRQRVERELFVRAFQRTIQHTRVMVLLAAMLLLSAAINAVRFDASASDAFAILRLLYFSAIIVFITAYSRKYGIGGLIVAFLLGILATTLDELARSIAIHQVVAGVVVLSDPNVIGNMLGVGVVFCSLAILSGMFVIPLLMAALFSALSVTTFSKGTWLMVALALAATAVAVRSVYPTLTRGRRRWLGAISMVTVAAIAAGLIAYWPLLRALLDFKLRTSVEGGSVTARSAFAVAGIYAMGDHPLIGLGLRNYPLTYWMYPGLMPEQAENAHNAFAQIGAVGGVFALFLLLVLFAYPFRTLWNVTDRIGLVSRVTYVAIIAACFVLSGAVQLQLVFQPFFWCFTGLLVGWRWYREEHD